VSEGEQYELEQTETFLQLKVSCIGNFLLDSEIFMF